MTSTVLIVDDSAAIHELVAASLAEDGYEIQHALDGTSGLAMAEANQPDLILLDVDMPDINGFEVCKRLKDNLATNMIGVVFLTASASADDRVRGLQLSSADYILKPFDPRELSLRTRTALRNIRMAKALDQSSPGDAGDHAGSRSVRTLQLGQIIHARSNNPWGRVPPAEKLRVGITGIT